MPLDTYPVCEACGYDVSGIASLHCPECSTPTRVCRVCGRTVTANELKRCRRCEGTMEHREGYSAHSAR